MAVQVGHGSVLGTRHKDGRPGNGSTANVLDAAAQRGLLSLGKMAGHKKDDEQKDQFFHYKLVLFDSVFAKNPLEIFLNGFGP